MARGATPTHIITPDSALGGLDIQHSVRFDKSNNHYFTRTPSSAGNRDTYTISCWVKKGSTGINQAIFYAGTTVGSNHNNVDAFLFNSGDYLEFFGEISQSVQYNIRTNRLFRDVSNWYHIVLAVDTTQGTSSNRIKIYVNGVQETSFSTASYMSQNQDRFVNATNLHVIGYTGGGRALDGNMAEYHFIDGSQLDPSYFGYTEPQTGIWRPKKYTYGNYGTNGFYLDFRDSSSTAALGHDRSGNVNNWTPNSFSVSAGEGNDSSFDTPSTNFITLNPIRRQNENCTLDNANLKATGPSGSYPGVTANMAITSGKWYYEFEMLNKAGSGHPLVGICQNDYISGGPDRICYTAGGNYISATPTEPSDPASVAVNDVIVVAIDLDDAAGKIRFYKNGTLQPVLAILNSVKSDLQISAVGGVYPYIQMYTNDVCTVNFGQRPFSYTPPSGHKKLIVNTNNSFLDNGTAPILDPKEHFNILLWTGNGSASRDITGLQYKPDLVWIKRRGGAQTHSWQDSLIGFGDDKTLRTDTTGALDTNGNLYGYINYTLPDGININGGTQASNNDSRTNAVSSNNTYVAWSWKAGGSTTVTNNEGSVTSHVSANTDAGFSIVKWTGNSNSSTTIGHGLNQKPEFIILKNTSGTENWRVYYTIADGSYDFMYLNTNGAVNHSGYALPTTSVFNKADTNGVNMMAYVWHSVPGYSKMGSYYGNGSNDGKFVYTGFKPAFVLLKRHTDGANYWEIRDNKRVPYNPNNERLFPNRNDTKSVGEGIDFFSNGFKLRNSGTGSNSNDKVYIYMAFADQPLTTQYGTQSNGE